LMTKKVKHKKTKAVKKNYNFRNVKFCKVWNGEN